MNRHDEYTFHIDDTVYKQYKYDDETDELIKDEAGEMVEVSDDTRMTYGEFKFAVESLIESIKDDLKSIVENKVG